MFKKNIPLELYINLNFYTMELPILCLFPEIGEDMINIIFSYLTTAEDLVRVSRVCKSFMLVYRNNNLHDRMAMLVNRTRVLLMKCPQFKWDLDYLCMNKDVDLSLLQKYPKFKLTKSILVELIKNGSDVEQIRNYAESRGMPNINPSNILFSKPNINIDEAVEYIQSEPPNQNDLMIFLSMNPQLSIEHIQLLGITKFDWVQVSKTNNLISPIIHTNLPWKINYLLCGNRTFSVQEILELKIIYVESIDKFDWNEICKHTPMTYQEFRCVIPPEKVKDCYKTFIKFGKIYVNEIDTIYTDLSLTKEEKIRMLTNHNLPLNLILLECVKYDDYEHILKNPSLNIKFIHLHHKKFSINHWNRISKNTGISLKDIVENKQYKWNYDAISSRPDITIKFVLDNPRMKFSWGTLSGNPSITVFDIVKYKHLPWNHEVLSSGIK